MTQKELIIDALKKKPKRGMSDREMMINLHMNRPSARMAELRRDGYVFAERLQKIQDKNGRVRMIKRYILVEEPEA